MHRDVVRAGVFCATGAVAVVLVTVALSKADWFTKYTAYTVVFSVSDGVGGLNRGSEVRVGGLKRGHVLEVATITEPETGRVVEIDVHIALDPSIALFSEPRVIRIAPLIGTAAWLDFRGLGEGTTPLAAGSRITASPGSGVLGAILGPEAAAQTSGAIGDFGTFAAWLASLPRDYKEHVYPALLNAEAVTVKLRDGIDLWTPRIDAGLASAASAAQNLDGGITEARTIMSQSAPKIDATLDNAAAGTADLREIMSRVRSEGLDSMLRLLARAEQGVESFSSAITDLHDVLVQAMPGLRSTLEDVRTSAGQLKLMSHEIRRSPWKLLYRPTTDEVAHENLYGAARSFAVAADDLRDAGETLREVLNREGTRFDSDSEFRAMIEKKVMDSVERYRKAERAMSDILQGASPAGEASGTR